MRKRLWRRSERGFKTMDMEGSARNIVKIVEDVGLEEAGSFVGLDGENEVV
jgi:hypothetical protein